MTIITSESRVISVKLEVTKPGYSIQNVLPSTLTPLRIVPESTTLVHDFILSFKELENYK